MPRKYSAADYDEDYGDDDYDFEEEEEEGGGKDYGRQFAGSKKATAPPSTSGSRGGKGGPTSLRVPPGGTNPMNVHPPSASEYPHQDPTADVAREAGSGGPWRCTVCTYDNPHGYLACDVCGAERASDWPPAEGPLPNGEPEPGRPQASNPHFREEVRLTIGQSESSSSRSRSPSSVLAQLLCAPAPRVRKKKAAVLREGGLGSEQGSFSLVPSPQTRPEIEVFRFDSPSPDDAVVASRSGAVNRIPPGFQPHAKPAAVQSEPETNQSRTTTVVGSETQPSTTASTSVPPKKKKGKDTQTPVDEEEDSDRPGISGRAAEITGGVKKFSLGAAREGAKQRQRQSLPLDSYIPEPWMLEKASDKEKELLHLIVVGHVDAGKSTLMGHLLHRLGQVSQKEMHKHAREAKEKGKGSFAFAWVLDEGAEERARGVTMSVAMAHFETPRLRVILLDAPGHRDFVPSMISGASQADAAILAVDAAPGAFEAGMEGERGPGGGGGQTKEHAQLARSLGVEQLLVAVTKMDAVGYAEGALERVRAELGPFLRHCGFREGNVRWLPVSGLEGQNLTEGPTNEKLTSWYRGPTLLEAIDSFPSPIRLIQRPLRLVLAETLRTRTLGQSAASGKLEAGAIRPGSKVLVQPIGEVASVKAIERDSAPLPRVLAGESVDVGLVGVDPAALLPGGVLSHPDYPVPVATRFEARILTLGITVPILKGTQVVLHAHSAREPAQVAQLSALLDPKTGAVTKQRVRALAANQSALVEIVPERGVCLEEYANYRALGRVALRDSGRTLAVGIVTKIISQQ